jgi:hypothetical protein
LVGAAEVATAFFLWITAEFIFTGFADGIASIIFASTIVGRYTGPLDIRATNRGAAHSAVTAWREGITGLSASPASSGIYTFEITTAGLFCATGIAERRAGFTLDAK